MSDNRLIIAILTGTSLLTKDAAQRRDASEINTTYEQTAHRQEPL